MSGNPMYGWPPGNGISQWHQQGPPPPPSNSMHYSSTVPNVNNPMIGMPNSEALQPSMQSVQPMHSMPSRQPHQSLQQQQMPRTANLYQPVQATTSPSQSQIPQQNSQFQQHPQQSHYSQYAPSVLPSQYWASPTTQQTPLGNLPPSQNTSGGFQQHQGLHQQSPTGSPLPHHSVRGHPPTSHTPDRGNIPPVLSTLQQTTSFPPAKDHSNTDQQMMSSLSRQGLQQQHSSGSIQMMQQNTSSLPISPTHGSSASQMRSMQQPQQPPSSWQQTNQYYQQQNQSRFPFAGSTNPYMAYGSNGGNDIPNNITAPTTQSASARHTINPKSNIDNNVRTARGTSSNWVGGNLYPQQQPSAQGGGNNNYYGYDSSSYYPMPGQSNVDSSQPLNNANIHQNQYWNAPPGHSQTPPNTVNRPMSCSLQHHGLVQQSPSASPLPHLSRNQPPSSHTPDRSPSIGNIPTPLAPAPSFPSPGQQSLSTKSAGGSNSLAQLEQMVMPHLGGTAGVVKSPSHSSSTSSPILNRAASSSSGINQQLPYPTNYNSSGASDTNSATYFSSSNPGQGQQQHSYFSQYGSNSEIPKTSTMWTDQAGSQVGPPTSAISASMMEASPHYDQSNQYETQTNYGDYASAVLTSSHEYGHMPQNETTFGPAPEAVDPYALDPRTFDGEYDEQRSTLKSKKGRPKKGDNNETKKERKPRAPRASKNASGPKGKKAKANVMQLDQSIDQRLQPVQFVSSDIVSTDYNSSMMNQEHFTAPQDPYNTSHLTHPGTQNIYNQTNLANLQTTIKPGDNQQLGANQDYIPYRDYSQSNSKPTNALEIHQNHICDNSIQNSIKSSDKNGNPSFHHPTNSHSIENNNGGASNTSHSIINSPVAKTNVPNCDIPSIHEVINKQNQIINDVVSDTNTSDILSSNPTVTISDNRNLISDSNGNHLNSTESICDKTDLDPNPDTNSDQNLARNESIQMRVMESGNQPAIYIQSQTNSYSTQQSHSTASSSPSVYGPGSLQPVISNQLLSSSPSHSPPRSSCSTRSMAMPSQSPTSMVAPMQTYGNSTLTHQGPQDSGKALSQSPAPTPSGYSMSSTNQYHPVQAPQQSVPTSPTVYGTNSQPSSPPPTEYTMKSQNQYHTVQAQQHSHDTGQDHQLITMSETMPYQKATNQSDALVPSCSSQSFIDNQTSQGDQPSEIHTNDDSAKTYREHSKQTLSSVGDTRLIDQCHSPMQKQSTEDSDRPRFSARNHLEPISTPTNTDNQSKLTSPPPPAFLDTATTHDPQPLKSPEVNSDNTLINNNIDQTTVTSIMGGAVVKEKSMADVPHRRKSKLKSNNNISGDPPETVAIPSAKAIDGCLESSKADCELEESLRTEMKPKVNRKRPSDSSGDKPPRRRRKHNVCDSEPVSESVNTVSVQQTKLESVVSPALSLSSTSTNSVAKQDLSPPLPNDKPVICLITGSSSIGPSSVSPATKATSNGSGSSGSSGHKSSRRRSSERRESVIEGLMRTSDFVIAKQDLKEEIPHLWRITNNNLLEKYTPIISEQNDKSDKPVKSDKPIRLVRPVIYVNTNQYLGWNPTIKGDYVGVDVKLTHNSRSQITVERLSLNLQSPKKTIEFYDSHFAVYVQILLNMCLDNQFWAIPEQEPDNLDYYMSSSRIIDDVIQRNKAKLLSNLKLDPENMECLDRYPNLTTKELENEEKKQHCMGCQNITSICLMYFSKESYKRDSLKAIESAEEEELKTIRLCNSCNEKVRLYSEMQHFKWKLYLKANAKVLSLIVDDNPQHSVLLDKCMKDKEWISTMFEERDKLWEKVERIMLLQES